MVEDVVPLPRLWIITDGLIHHGRLLRHKGHSWRVTYALLK